MESELKLDYFGDRLSMPIALAACFKFSLSKS